MITIGPRPPRPWNIGDPGVRRANRDAHSTSTKMLKSPYFTAFSASRKAEVAWVLKSNPINPPFEHWHRETFAVARCDGPLLVA